VSIAFQNEVVSPGKLVVAPADAAQWVMQQIERGTVIRKAKVRNAEDLEKAREKKSEWVNQTNDLLKAMFDTESVAQEFNTWEVRVLPDYADLSLFIDVFYEEMDQRLMRLNSIHRRIPAVNGLNGLAVPSTPRPSLAAASAVSAAPAAAVKVSARSAISLAIAEGISAPAQAGDQHGSCLVLLHGETAAAADRVSEFVSRLDFDPVRVEISHENNAAAIEKFEQNANAAFAMIVLDGPTAASARPGSGGQVDSRLVFQLGYCVGKLGLRRICVLFPDSGGSFCDEHGVLFVPLDAADGWQLQVARQLRRSGIEIDLNRLC
jgi:uncharacterized protein Usg